MIDTVADVDDHNDQLLVGVEHKDESAAVIVPIDSTPDDVNRLLDRLRDRTVNELVAQDQRLVISLDEPDEPKIDRTGTKYGSLLKGSEIREGRS